MAGLIALGAFLLVIFIVIAVLVDTGRRSPPSPAALPAPRAVTAPDQTKDIPTPQAKPPEAGGTMVVSKPAIGVGLTLTAPMIRYCLAEEIRLEAAEAAIRPKRNADIDRYNAMVDDYNGRCINYRYYEADMIAALAEVEQYRTQLTKEGESRVRGRK